MQVINLTKQLKLAEKVAILGASTLSFICKLE